MAEATYPDDLLYHDEHDWARIEGDAGDLRDHLVRPGLRSARSSSSTRPRSARRSTKTPSYAEVESVKAVSDVIAPLSGEVVEVNEALADAPEQINEDPYGEGWLVKVKLTAPERGRGACSAPRHTASCWKASREAPPPASVALAAVTRYTSATARRPAPRCSPRSASSSVDELFEQIPEPLRLGRPLELPDGHERGRGLRAAGRAGRAQRRRRGAGLLRRRRDVRPLRAGDRRRDHPALRVPHPLHALPAGDLPGRAAGDVRVPDRDVGADRAAGLQRRPLRGALLGRLGRLPGDGRDRAHAASSSRAASTRTAARRSRPTRVGYGAEVVEVGLEGGRDRRRGAGRGGRRRDRRRLPAEPQLPRRGRGRRGARRRREGARRAAGRRLRPDDARASSSRPASAAPTSPSARASRSATGSTSAAPRSASSARPRSRSAACRAGSPARPRTSTAAAASSSPCRPASSTSAARRRPTTSAPPRR